MFFSTRLPWTKRKQENGLNSDVQSEYIFDFNQKMQVQRTHT